MYFSIIRSFYYKCWIFSS